MEGQSPPAGRGRVDRLHRELHRELLRDGYRVPAISPGAQAAHRALVLATAPRSPRGTVVSHASAAVLHGLPLLDPPPGLVQVTQQGVRGSRHRGLVHLHAAPVPATEVVELDGMPVTSLARTVVDLARSTSFVQGVVAADAALRGGLPAAELAAAVARGRHRPGIGQARRAVGFADGRSAGVAATLSRVLFHAAGLPPPELAVDVRDAGGMPVLTADFGWAEQRTLGAVEAVPTDPAGAVPVPGWQLVRWGLAALTEPERLVLRIRRAFRRGART